MASDEALLERIAGWQCPVDLACDLTPFIRRLTAFLDKDGCEDGERLNGVCRCPECSTWWPIIESPIGWEEGELKMDTVSESGVRYSAGDVAHKATMWAGHAECLECESLMVQDVDGSMIQIF
jgi:hypothetical protein